MFEDLRVLCTSLASSTSLELHKARGLRHAPALSSYNARGLRHEFERAKFL